MEIKELRIIKHFKWSKWKDVKIYKHLHGSQFYLIQFKVNENGLKRFRNVEMNDKLKGCYTIANIELKEIEI